MPFTFDRLYKYDITPTLKDLGIDLHSHSFDVKVHIESYTGTVLSSDVLPKPTIIFVPGTGKRYIDVSTLTNTYVLMYRHVETHR